MKIEHLYCFIIIAETGSINKAAQRLYVSQQHLSRIIKSIEESLNVTLFDRTVTGVEITEEGNKFLEFANVIVDDYREMESYFYMHSLPAIEETDHIEGDCGITFPFFFSVYLNDFLQQSRTRFPDINLDYAENQGTYNTEDIYESDRLFLYVDLPEQAKKLEQNKLVSYPVGMTHASVCVNRNSELGSKEILHKGDLNRCPVTAYPNEEWSLDEYENILFSSSNIYQHLSSVLVNNSVCVVPDYIKTGVNKQYPDVKLIPYQYSVSFPIFIMHSKKHKLSDADRAMIRFLHDFFQDLTNEKDGETIRALKGLA